MSGCGECGAADGWTKHKPGCSQAVRTPSCPMCLGGAMVASTPLGTWRCPCGAALATAALDTPPDDVTETEIPAPVLKCERHHWLEHQGACPMCESEAEDTARFRDAALLHSISTAGRSLLAVWQAAPNAGATPLSPDVVAWHAEQLANAIVGRRGRASEQGYSEVQLLRGIAQDALDLSRRNPELVGASLQALLEEWLTDYEGPRHGITPETIPPGTELVDVVTSLRPRSDWKPHT